MKKTLFLLLILLNFQIVKSQDSTIAKNKFETFNSQTGTLLKTVEEQIDKVKDLSLSVITIKNVASGEELKALHITKNASAFFGNIVLQDFTIDWEEIKGFNDALKYIKKQVDAGKPNLNIYFTYSTSNGGYISAYYYKGAYGSIWKVTLGRKYKYSRMNITGSDFDLKNKNIDDLTEAIDGIIK